MNPWGLLESRSFALERERLHGTDITLGELVTTLRGFKGNLPEETVRLTGRAMARNDLPASREQRWQAIPARRQWPRCRDCP